MLPYELFLFDLDDTLLDFKESEKLALHSSLISLGFNDNFSILYEIYQIENKKLWKLFEEGKVTKDFLKIERFKKTFNHFKLDLDPILANHCYLDSLPKNVVLIDFAETLCKQLYKLGEIGIVTNGINHVQTERIKNSAIAPYISFVAVSEICGHAKPNSRFFDYSISLAKKYVREKTIVMGDRLEADILGANLYQLDSCWFNPHKNKNDLRIEPKYEISCLSQFIPKILDS